MFLENPPTCLPAYIVYLLVVKICLFATHTRNNCSQQPAPGSQCSPPELVDFVGRPRSEWAERKKKRNKKGGKERKERKGKEMKKEMKRKEKKRKEKREEKVGGSRVKHSPP